MVITTHEDLVLSDQQVFVRYQPSCVPNEVKYINKVKDWLYSQWTPPNQSDKINFYCPYKTYKEIWVQCNTTKKHTDRSRASYTHAQTLERGKAAVACIPYIAYNFDLYTTTILAQLSNNSFSHTHVQAYIRMHTYPQAHRAHVHQAQIN